MDLAFNVPFFSKNTGCILSQILASYPGALKSEKSVPGIHCLHFSILKCLGTSLLKFILKSAMLFAYSAGRSMK